MSDLLVSGAKKKARRSIKNYLLFPFVQMRFGIYAVILSISFSVVTSAVLYFNLSKFAEIVLELTGVEAEVKDLLFQYLIPVRNQLLAIMVIFIALTVIISIKITHKLVGPTIAFRRHIAMISAGKWDYRTHLRDGDAFFEVAEDLNQLSETFQKKYGSFK